MQKVKVKILIFLVLLLVSFSAKAQGIQDAFKNGGPLDKVSGQQGAGYNITNSSPLPIVGLIIKAVLSLLGVIFLVLMIYGGYLWMTDRGNDQTVEKAKNLISAAIIGLIIILGAYAISYFVVNVLQGGTLVSVNTPFVSP